jgi:hypothetical protein
MGSGRRLKLIDEERAQRMEELRNDASITDIDEELNALTMLEEEAINGNNIRLALDVIRTRGSLCQSAETNKIRQGELLAKAALVQIAQKMVGIIAQNIEGKFLGWEQSLDDIQQGFITVVAEAKNIDDPS